jgi:hypothetical protein
MTNYKVVPYDIPYIVSNFEPNLTEVDLLIGLVRCPFEMFYSLNAANFFGKRQMTKMFDQIDWVLGSPM